MKFKELVAKQMRQRRRSGASDPGSVSTSKQFRKPKLQKRQSQVLHSPPMDPPDSIPARLNINVAVRVRPLNTREKQNGDEFLWKTTSSSISTSDQFDCEELSHSNASGLSYSFDHVFDETKTTQVVYKEFAQPVVKPCLEGYNGTLFAYGQTSAGKTYSVFGDQEKGHHGLTQLAVKELFDFIRSTSDMECLLRLSYLELYNETLKDLLEPENTSSLRIVEDKSRGVYVRGLKEVVVASEEEVVQIILLGESNRHFGCTKMNERSSRSHTVVMFILETRETVKSELGDESELEDDENESKADHETSSNSSRRRSIGEETNSTVQSDEEDSLPKFKPGDRPVKVSTLNLVDLAGSERGGKSGAKGEQLQEANAINKSLTVLGLVIMKLANAQQSEQFGSSLGTPTSASKASKHIPFRDSKLTRILSSSLGGNANTGILCCVSPARSNVSETQSTLDFATRAKKIVNHAVVNETVPTATLLHRYKSEIKKLKAQLAQLAVHGTPATTAQGLLHNGGLHSNGAKHVTNTERSSRRSTVTGVESHETQHNSSQVRQRSETVPTIHNTPSDYLVRTRHRVLLKDLETQFGEKEPLKVDVNKTEHLGGEELEVFNVTSDEQVSCEAEDSKTGNRLAKTKLHIQPSTQREHNLAKQLEGIQAEKDNIKARLLELQRSMFTPHSAVVTAVGVASLRSPRSTFEPVDQGISHLSRMQVKASLDSVTKHAVSPGRRRTSIDIGSLAHIQAAEAASIAYENQAVIGQSTGDPGKNESQSVPLGDGSSRTQLRAPSPLLTSQSMELRDGDEGCKSVLDIEQSKVYRKAFSLLVALSRKQDNAKRDVDQSVDTDRDIRSTKKTSPIVDLRKPSSPAYSMHQVKDLGPSTSWDKDMLQKLLSSEVLDEILLRVTEAERLKTTLDNANSTISQLESDLQASRNQAQLEKSNRLQISKELYEVQTALEQMTCLVKTYVLNAEM